MNFTLFRLVAATLIVSVMASSHSVAMDKHADNHEGHNHKRITMEIMMPLLAPTLEGSPVGGGYLIVRNIGVESDRLLGGSADFAARVEVHEMAMENDIMKMRALPDGLEIAAGEQMVLKPGGYHLMFMGLSSQLISGDTHKITLQFEKAGEIDVAFVVKERAAIQKELSGEQMDHSHAEHTGHEHNH